MSLCTKDDRFTRFNVKGFGTICITDLYSGYLLQFVQAFYMDRTSLEGHVRDQRTG